MDMTTSDFDAPERASRLDPIEELLTPVAQREDFVAATQRGRSVGRKLLDEMRRREAPLLLYRATETLSDARIQEGHRIGFYQILAEAAMIARVIPED